jgi:hypothetical protein
MPLFPTTGMVAEAMNAIWTFTHDHDHESEDELALQLLGIRLFNAAGASIKLALSGYYQKAFDQLRDVIETSFLVDYLSTYPAEIDEWRRADQKKRMSQFGATSLQRSAPQAPGHAVMQSHGITPSPRADSQSQDRQNARTHYSANVARSCRRVVEY